MVSEFENFPVSLLEAMKFESVVLASRVGGIPEFVEDGVNGVLVAPRDIAGISAALVSLYRNPELRRKLIDNGNRVVQEYSVARSVERHVELYRRLASQ